MKYFKISFYLNVLLFITAGFICLVLIECCFHFNTYLSQLRNQSQLTFSSSSKESFKNKVIVGIGGSSLYGEPYDGKIDIFKILKLYHPSNEWNYLNLSKKGEALSSLMPQALEAISRRPEFFLANVGHNEFQTSNLNGAQCQGQFQLSCVNNFLLCHWINSKLALIQSKQRIKNIRPDNFYGGNAFCLEEKNKIMSDFYKNLHILADTCQKYKVKMILLFPPGLQKGLSPNRSVYLGRPRDKKAFKIFFKKGYVALKNKNYSQAINFFEMARKIDDKFSHLLYFLGQSYYENGSLEIAKKLFQQAINFDTFPSRASEDLWNIYKKIKNDFPNLTLLDGREILANKVQDHILSFELFHDLQHPNLKGYHYLAQELEDVLIKKHFLSSRSLIMKTLSEEEIAKDLNFESKDWFKLYYSRIKWFEMMSYRASWPEDRYQSMLVNLKQARSLYRKEFANQSLFVPSLGQIKIPISNLDNFENLAISRKQELEKYEMGQ